MVLIRFAICTLRIIAYAARPLFNYVPGVNYIHAFAKLPLPTAKPKAGIEGVDHQFEPGIDRSGIRLSKANEKVLPNALSLTPSWHSLCQRVFW